jgi:MtN3 and saliva related transmembrane protein
LEFPAWFLFIAGMRINDYTTIVGLVAACCTTISFLPQAVKTIKTNDTSSISATMYGLFTFGSIVWAAYGFLTYNLPVIIANVITSLLALIIFYYKLRSLIRARKKGAMSSQ